MYAPICRELYLRLQGRRCSSAIYFDVIWPRSHLRRVLRRRAPLEPTGPSLETDPAAAAAASAVVLRPRHELSQREAGLDVCPRQQLGGWEAGSVHTSDAESTCAELCAVILSAVLCWQLAMAVLCMRSLCRLGVLDWGVTEQLLVSW